MYCKYDCESGVSFGNKWSRFRRVIIGRIFLVGSFVARGEGDGGVGSS